MAETTDQMSSDVIDAIRPDLEAFASLWSALRTNYQGTNITKTVARLLHIYQPEEGVLAYERLLRTLYVLLEDFDCDGLRLLVSMVPPPIGVPDITIRDVFHKATGFVRLNAPIFHRNNTSYLDNETDSSDGKIGGDNPDLQTPIVNPENSRSRNFHNPTCNTLGNSGILRAVVKSDRSRKIDNSPRIGTRESEVFRGFPTTEITTTQSHAKSMTHHYGPSMNFSDYTATQRYVDYQNGQKPMENLNPSRGIDSSTVSSAYRLKWFEAPMLMRKNNYDTGTTCPDLILKTSDNKYIRLPITKVNGPAISNYAPSYNSHLQHPYQSYFRSNQIHMRNSLGENLQSRDYSTIQSQSRVKKEFVEERTNESSAHRVIASKNNLIDHDYEFTKFDENFVEKNLLIENINSPSNSAIEKFRDVVKIRQRAIQEDIYRMDVVQSEQDIVESSTEEIEKIDAECLSIAEELRKGVKNFLQRAEEEQSIEPLFPRTRALEQSWKFPKKISPSLKSSRMWKLERLPNYQQKSKNSMDLRENVIDDKSNFSSFMDANATKVYHSETEQNLFATRSERNSRVFGEENNVGHFSREINAEIESRTLDAFHQSNSISELVNYRKQYYDALLSIQRAKVAVANSLAISSSQTSTNYDPRVLQYLQQQHRMLHNQQQQILIGSQNSVTRSSMVQPGYTDIRNSGGLWIRPSDWKYSSCGRYAFPRHAHSMSSSSGNPQIPMNMPKDPSKVNDTRRSAHNLSSGNPQKPMNMPKDPSKVDDTRRSAHNLPLNSQNLPVKRRKLEEIVGKLKENDDLI